jgi:hypothetical protein
VSSRDSLYMSWCLPAAVQLPVAVAVAVADAVLASASASCCSSSREQGVKSREQRGLLRVAGSCKTPSDWN